jgi:hypothetical protein
MNVKKYSNLQRIQRVLNYYYKMGCNKESVNKVYHKILKLKYENRN